MERYIIRCNYEKIFDSRTTHYVPRKSCLSNVSHVQAFDHLDVSKFFRW